MKLVICSIRDSKSDAFGNPFFATTKGVAERIFTDAVNDPTPNNQLNMHPSDFTCYVIGEFDDSNGNISSFVPELLAYADSVLK